MVKGFKNSPKSSELDDIVNDCDSNSEVSNTFSETKLSKKKQIKDTEDLNSLLSDICLESKKKINTSKINKMLMFIQLNVMMIHS